MQEMTKRLSIIVPAYNTVQTIVRCLDSIFSQLTGELKDAVEVVAVEDRSPDNVGEILDEYQKGHPELKVIHRATNGGEAGAHNTGMEASCGEYFLRLDSDDALKPGSVARLLELAAEFKPDILLHAFTSVTPEGNVISQSGFGCEGLLDLDCATKTDVRHAFSSVAFGIMTPSVVYRRAIAPDVRQDPKYKIAGDRYFGWQFFAKSKRFYLTNESFVDYYIYPNSMSRVLSDQAVSGLLELNIKFWNEIQRHPQFPIGRVPAFNRIFFSQVGWDYEIVFKAEPEKLKHADEYFAALSNFLRDGTSLRALGVFHYYLKLACWQKSPRMVGLYHNVFYKYVWRAERKAKRILKKAWSKIGS